MVIGGVRLHGLIDPELARATADYARNFRLLEMARLGVLALAAGFACVLWIACCWLVVRAKGRSLGWVAFAAAGPPGFALIAALRDRAPQPGEPYPRFVGRLSTLRRVVLEAVLFAAIWSAAYWLVVVKRELMIGFESLTTGAPVAAIVAQQAASSGMWAAGEGMQALYLVPLLYLLWPVLFNLAASRLAAGAAQARE